MTLLMDLIKKHEGLELKVYKCPAGKLTIGYGRNVEDLGISEFEAEFLLTNDVARCCSEATKNFPWFAGLPTKRQAVIICMIFQLGISRFKGFKKMIAYMEQKEYYKAADEAMDSSWAKQTPKRAKELTDLLRAYD